MLIEVVKSKIHRAIVTEANLNYAGSITIDEDLMDAANMIEHEKIQVVNVNTTTNHQTIYISNLLLYLLYVQVSQRVLQRSCLPL